MADNKNIKTQQDRIRVDSKDPSEVEYLHQKFPAFSHQEILQAIRRAGPYLKAIIEYLRTKEKGNSRC